MSELQELKEKITNYTNQLEELKSKLEAESKTLNINTKKGYKRQRQIEETLKEIKKHEENVRKYNNLGIVRDKLSLLLDNSKSQEEKEKAIKLLVDYFTKFKENANYEWQNIASEYAGQNLNDVLKTLKAEISTLEDKIEKAHKVKLTYVEDEELLAKKINDYEIITNYNMAKGIDPEKLKDITKEIVITPEPEVQNDEKPGKKGKKEKNHKVFKLFKKNKKQEEKEPQEDNNVPTKVPVLNDEEKKNVVEEFTKTLDKIEKSKAEDILNNQIDFTKENKKTETKSLLNKLTNKLKNHPVFTGIATTAITAAILLSCKGLVKNTEDKKDDTILKPTPTPGIEATIVEEPTLKDELEDLGYDDHHADLMAENFSEETIENVKDNGYVEEIENYATVKYFKMEYLDDYEIATKTYNLEPYDAVDFVNRAHSLQFANFFPDSTINDVVEILREIDKHELENNNAGLITIRLSEITDNYLFNKITDEDIVILNTLPYLAERDTDEYNFLVHYADLIKKSITEPSNEEYRQQLQQFIRIFAENKANAQYNEPTHLSDDIVFNNDAIVENNRSWIETLKLYIDPTFMIAYPYPYESEEYREGEELSNLLYSGLNIVAEQCDQDSLTTGGR